MIFLRIHLSVKRPFMFFHTFIDFGSTVLYRQYMRSPTKFQEASTHTAEYEMAGFPGAIGSTDATQIMLLEHVSYHLRQTRIGFKISHTARTYNITVNHRRQIHATTSGHPARWNNKTLGAVEQDCEGIRFVRSRGFHAIVFSFVPIETHD